MKAAKRFFLIGGIMCLLFSVINTIINTEVEYDNKALCIYIDYALFTLSISIMTLLIGITFLIVSAGVDDDDFSHIVRKY
jgi:uncharacterized membrane protein (DUF106 family)